MNRTELFGRGKMRDLMQIGMSQAKIRLEDLRGAKDEAAQKFANYLSYYRPKTARSRHGLLGPVAEVVRLAAKPLITPGQAAGRAARMHEMAQGGSRVSPEGIQALEEAVKDFFSLMESCPVHLRRTVSDRVLDQVYLLVRKAEQKFWGEWTEWLKNKYKAVEALNKTWGTSYADWDRVRYRKADASDAAKSDFEAFKKSLEAAGEAVPEPEDIDQD